MKKIHLLVLLLTFLYIPAFSQENPKIDKELLIQKTKNKRVALGNLKRGDFYFKNKIYDEALTYYLKLYQHCTDHSPLNYKIGVSSLYGTNPKNSLKYLLLTNPKTTSDYYYQLGKAYQQKYLYKDAQESFRTYIMSLPFASQKKAASEIRQLTKSCELADKLMRDSVPVYIINMGPGINSYYDDYAAVELKQESKIFFTSRRPDRNMQKVENPSAFKERIFYSNYSIDVSPNEAREHLKLKSVNNISVAGCDNINNTLLYYVGGNKQGQIRKAVFNNGKLKQRRVLRGKVNTKAYQETTFTIDDAGNRYFVSQRRNGNGGKDIWYVKRKGKNSYSRPVNLGSEINSTGNEECVFISPDGKTLYFSSNGHPGMGGFDIFKVEKGENGLWSKPQNMGYPINSGSDDLFYHPTADSMIALFATKRPGGFGGLDVYKIKKDPRIPFVLSGTITDKVTGKLLPGTVTLFNNADNLPVGTAVVDSLAGYYNLAMEDGGDFYIQADAPGYRSVNEPFTTPKKRHAKLEQHFKLEKLLYPYTLSGKVYNQRTGLPLQAEIVFKPLNIDSVIYRVVSNAQTGHYSITFEDKTNLKMEITVPDYFGVSENLMLRSEKVSSGEKNIGMLRSISTYTVTGIIKEENSANFIASLVRIFLPGNENPIHSVNTTKEEGKYEINLDNTGPFLLEITAEGYFFNYKAIQFHPDSTLMTRDFDLKKIKTGARIVIANILFNTGTATLKAESYSELSKLVNLLRENPHVRIEVSGHTDNVGSATINKKLSRSRALSVKNYLVSQGISGDRVDFEGYGFDKPIAPNETSEGRAANRRVEIEVLD